MNGTIWIGMMNQLIKRVELSIEANRLAVERIGILQSDANIMKLYSLASQPRMPL